MGRRSTKATRIGGWLPFVLLLGSGCDFFQELKNEPVEGATEGDSESDSASEDTAATEGSGPCEIAEDDLCLDQDTVLSCSPSDGTLSELDCASLCGGNTNFSCIATATGQHACWCVAPGAHKVLSCSQLEDCLSDCDQSQTFQCADRCFERTDAPTIRLFGALMHCAEATCEQTCRDNPGACQSCLTSARVDGGGGCSLPRAVCDDDRSPDEPWP